jgi:hypothetical protein
MTAEDLETYLEGLGLVVQRLTDPGGNEFSVALAVEIPNGGLRGLCCDIALARVMSEPYLLPAAIHTRPALVAMDGSPPLSTMASSLGGNWQYWSRRFDHAPAPRLIWAHVLGVLCDERWTPIVANGDQS